MDGWQSSIFEEEVTVETVVSVLQGPRGVLLISVSVRQHSLHLNFLHQCSLQELLIVLASFEG